MSSSAEILGRPRILNDKEKRQIISKFISGNAEKTIQNVTLVKEYCNKNISNSTIKNILHKYDLKNYRKQKKPVISKSNLKKRKNYYEKHKNHTFQDFQNIIFSDESRFTLLNANGERHSTKNAIQSQVQNLSLGLKNLWGRVDDLGFCNISRKIKNF